MLDICPVGMAEDEKALHAAEVGAMLPDGARGRRGLHALRMAAGGAGTQKGTAAHGG